MCGIVCAFNLKSSSEQLRPKILKMAKKIRHRGPDWNGIYCSKNAILAHERLAIVDPTSGRQPIYNNDKSLILAANGEIYNHLELKKNTHLIINLQLHQIVKLFLLYIKKKVRVFLII